MAKANQRYSFSLGCAAYIIVEGAYTTRLSKSVRDRWLDACQRIFGNPPPPSRQQLTDIFEAKLHEQGNKSALCGA